jgi:hypothetical protein
MRIIKSVSTVAAIMAMAGLGGAAQGAITFDVLGLAGSGVTGKVTFGYTSTSGTAAALTITIENTTASTARISAFAFNVPTISGAAFTTIGGASSAGTVVAIAPSASSAIPENSASNETGWYEKWKSNDIKTPNAAGDFDFGVMNADNSNSFITDGVGSGPSILNAVDANDSTTYTFNVVGTGLQSVSDSDFETAFMSELSANAGFYSFGVRFQGIPGNVTSDLAVPTTNPIPVPGAVVLAGLGMGLVGLVRRRVA